MKSTLHVFATCPESRTVAREEYRAHVSEVARWSEDVGCEGILVYSENGLIDPWLLAQMVIEATTALEPLVAVQPVYMHPYAVAKMVATIAFLHGRRVQLNMVAGGFPRDLEALGDAAVHDDRYRRVLEYAEIVRDLTAGAPPISRGGRYYRTHELRLEPAIPSALQPSFMISGSSEAGLEAARALGATAVRYPRPAGEEDAGEASTGVRNGIRVGIIAREDREEAWQIAYERFPEDRAGQITHRLAMSASDSHWHAQLSRLALEAAERGNAYWLGPFENYATFCPYLVGDYELVAGELSAYLRNGYDTVILDIPPSREDLEHTFVALEAAVSGVGETAR